MIELKKSDGYILYCALHSTCADIATARFHTVK